MVPRKSLILLVFALMACGRSNTMQRNQQPYDVVQEGSTQGVTSTINAPGETNPPVAEPTITGTNVDTTTAFTLPATATSTTGTQQPGTIAGTLPTTTTTAPPHVTASRVPRPEKTEKTETAAAPAPTVTDTVAPPTTTSSTDTTSTTKTDTTKTDTQPPPVSR